MAEGTTACAATAGDGSTTAATRFRTNHHRHFPDAIGLIGYTSSQANRLRRRLVIIHKLNLGTTRLPIVHTTASHQADNELFIEWAADRSPRKLRHQHRGGTKNATFRT